VINHGNRSRHTLRDSDITSEMEKTQCHFNIDDGSFDLHEDEPINPLLLARYVNYDSYAEKPSQESFSITEVSEAMSNFTESSSGFVGSRAQNDRDEDELDLLDPRHSKTNVGFVQNPYSRIVMVAIPGFLTILAGGAMLQNITAGQSNSAPVVTPSASPVADANSDSVNRTNSEEIAKYKAETALAQQQIVFQKKQPITPSNPTPTQAVLPAPAAIAPEIPEPVTPLPPPPPVIHSPESNEADSLPADPVARWKVAATAGGFGRVTNFSAPVQAAPVQQAPVYVPPAQQTQSYSETGSGVAKPINQLRAASSSDGLRDKPPAPVLVGATANGQLATAIVVAGDNTQVNDGNGTKYLAKLNTPLKDADGNVAIPADAVLVMSAKSFSNQSGVVEFQVSSVIVNNREYSAPKGALLVRGNNGAPLTLAKRGGSGGNFFTTALPAVLAGVGQAGQALNQPNASSVVSAGSVTTTTSSSKPNIAGAFASGMSNSLSQQLTQQLQMANQRNMNAPVVWELGAGTDIVVFVNQSFEM